MARFTEHDRDLIDETVTTWRNQCLVADASLLFPVEHANTWTTANVADLRIRFDEGALHGQVAGGTFASKWRQQLDGASPDVRLLAAELLLVHFLFASSVTARGKWDVIDIALEGTDLEPPDDSVPVRALNQQIGHPGIGFNTRRDIQVRYLIDFVQRLKAMDAAKRDEVLGDAWALRDFADETDVPLREMRHILLHLLAPDRFERIASGTHKREIAEAFKGLLAPDAPSDLDERLFAIRQSLERYLKTDEFDFYWSPLEGVWRAGSDGGDDKASDLESLEWKKQIILYGPPGTSKTFEARRIAETLIRRAALDRWKPELFFANQELVDDLVKRNIFWLQLHPGYGYDQFVRGLRLEGDTTRYRPGYLPHVVAELENQDLPDGLAPLPGVLVLDEINRTNLSEMLGEAFSLLERDQRGQTVALPGFDDGQDPDLLVIPNDLYVIGTMNEIDQSVETLDFALRRRFLWRECPFERDTLLAIIKQRWKEDVGKWSYEDASTQLEWLADQADELNAAIAASPELGHQYQIGHAYFADIAFFIGVWARSRKSRPANGSFLWTGNDRPQPPLADLWGRSLRPLLMQYLAGAASPDEELKVFATAFFGG
jgi:5-methylcytosine-specific restriction enzyme B